MIVVASWVMYRTLAPILACVGTRRPRAGVNIALHQETFGFPRIIHVLAG